MDLILWRHADAFDGVPDMQRALTAKGSKQAKDVAKWLNARLPADARILVSPAVRAQQTAEALERPFQTVAELAPGADATAILLASGWPEGAGTVLVVGHQPTLGQAAAMLLFGEERELSLKKGGLVWLTNRVRRDERQTVLKAAMSPELA
jgi:phosphohistidine phosphatase